MLEVDERTATLPFFVTPIREVILIKVLQPTAVGCKKLYFAIVAVF